MCKLKKPGNCLLAASALIACCLSLTPANVAWAADATNVKNVVVIYSYGSVLPANVIIDRVLRENMRSAGESRIEIYDEYLDRARFADPEHLELSTEYLQKKYAGQSVDLLIAGGSAALDFLQERRSTLFPDTPLIYSCVGHDRVTSDASLANIPGVQIHLDLKTTAELAIALQPDAKRLFVITGMSQSDRDWKRLAEERLAPYQKTLQIEYLSGLPLDELLRRVEQIPSGAIVIFLLYMQDGDGQHLSSPEVVELVADVSPAPVYGIYNTYHGRGIVGGHFATFEELGKATADLSLQVLNRTDPIQSVSVPQAPVQNRLDWRRMEHWGLDPSRLPNGSIVDFRELSAWERYPGRIMSALTLMALQTTLIVLLLVQIRRRRIAERSRLASQEDARRQRDELARVNRVMTVGELSTSIAHEVNQPLSAIVSNAQAAVRLLQRSPPDTEEVAIALQDIANDGNRAAGILNHVRSLARKEQPTRVPLDLNDVVRDVLRLAASDADNRGIVICEVLDDAIPSIKGDEIGLQQVILNLLVNAAHAMQDVGHKSRRIVVRTSHDTAAVLLEIEDSGIGLQDEQLNQVFDAFYTKRPGGIGMGLWICQAIIESHEGRIWATQNASSGATFHVRLPAVSSAECGFTDDQTAGILR